jgi:hypothetical protein
MIINPAVKILIEMSPENYELFVAECDITSRDYMVLKNGVVAREGTDTGRVVRILCDQDEAVGLLEIATRRYPEAVPAVREALDLAREL